MLRLASILFVLATTSGFSQTPIASAEQPIRGTVERYILSPHGEVDGLLLSDKTTVKFPSHLSSQLTSAVKLGDTVTVMPDRFPGQMTAVGRGVRAASIKNDKSGLTVTDVPPATPPVPPEERGIRQTERSAEGSIKNFLVNDKGDADGVILESGQEVKFPPHVGRELTSRYSQRQSGTLQASGLGVKNSLGEVIDAERMSYNGQALTSLESGPRRGRPLPPAE